LEDQTHFYSCYFEKRFPTSTVGVLAFLIRSFNVSYGKSQCQYRRKYHNDSGLYWNNFNTNESSMKLMQHFWEAFPTTKSKCFRYKALDSTNTSFLFKLWFITGSTVIHHPLHCNSNYFVKHIAHDCKRPKRTYRIWQHCTAAYTPKLRCGGKKRAIASPRS